MVGILLNQKFLGAGQMLISLLTHATKLRRIDWAQNLLYIFDIYIDMLPPQVVRTIYRTRVGSLAMLVTNWLTDCRLVNLIDMTLACEDAHSKLIEVFTVADVESCWQQFVADSEAEVWS